MTRERSACAVCLHAISAIHIWWGVTFLRVGEIHPAFGGTAFFRDAGGDAYVWGSILVLVAVGASVGVHIRELWASAVLALPQQAIIFLAAVHACNTQIPQIDHMVSQLAAPYVIGFLVIHSAALIGKHA